MALVYNQLLKLMKEKGITEYQIRVRDKVVGGATMDKLMGKASGHIDTRSIDRLCAYLHCQPGDIMEYVPDGETEE